MDFGASRRKIKEDVELFKKESPEDAKARRNKYCKRCVYRVADPMKDKNGKDQPYTAGCYYIVIEGKMRPCAPSECKEKGIFVKGKRLTPGQKLQKLHD